MDIGKVKGYIADTNIILDELEVVIQKYKLVLMSTTRQELDKHKTSDKDELKHKARRVNDYIFRNYDEFIHDIGEYNPEVILGEDFTRDVKDNRIIACAVKKDYGIITNDLNMFTTAKAFGLEVITYDARGYEEESEYQGYIEVEMTKSEYQEFHDNRLDKNEFDLMLNQYLLVYDIDSEVDDFGNKVPIQSFIWDGEYYVHTKNKTIKSDFLNDFTPRDMHQESALDSVMRNQITLLRGQAGTAKTLIAISYALQQLQAEKIGKIVIFSNTFPAKDAFYNGLVKGDLLDKLRQSSIGNILTSKVGSFELVMEMIMEERLLLMPASEIRGFDTTGMNAFLIITEAQNWSNSLLQLGIQRLSSDSRMCIEGDNATQLDVMQFGGNKNGMRIASRVFRGLNYYGEVELKNIYRSEMARQAQKMTDPEYLY